MKREVIYSEKAPKPVGPYSQAIRVNEFVFVSGQIPVDPVTGKLVKGGVGEQTERVLENLKEILREAGCSLADVVRVTVYLKRAEDFREMNRVYERYFSESKPARITVICEPPVEGALIEIDAIAYRD